MKKLKTPGVINISTLEGTPGVINISSLEGQEEKKEDKSKEKLKLKLDAANMMKALQ